jgi:hypothetical protein
MHGATHIKSTLDVFIQNYQLPLSFAYKVICTFLCDNFGGEGGEVALVSAFTVTGVRTRTRVVNEALLMCHAPRPIKLGPPSLSRSN